MRVVCIAWMLCVVAPVHAQTPAPAPAPPPTVPPPSPPPPVNAPQPTTEDTPAPANPPTPITASANADATVAVSVAPMVPVHIEYGLDFGFGPVRGDTPSQGYGGVYALPVNLYVLPWLGFGARAQLVYSQDVAVDDTTTPERSDGNETDPLAAWSVTAGPRFRIWSDPAARLRWVIDLDAGYISAEPMSPAGPLARVTLGRTVGLFDHRGNGVNIGLAVGAETGLGAASPYRTVYGSFWFHGESGIRAQSSPGPDDAWFPSTFTVDVPMLLGTNFGSVDANLVFGLSAAYGIAVSALLEPRVRVDTLYLRHSEDDSTKQLGASAGTRLRFDRWVAAFVDLYGGYALSYGVEPLLIGSGPFVDVGAGLHSVNCKFAADIGVRLRIGVGDDNRKLAAIALVLGGARGNTPGALGISLKKKCD